MLFRSKVPATESKGIIANVGGNGRNYSIFDDQIITETLAYLHNEDQQEKIDKKKFSSIKKVIKHKRCISSVPKIKLLSKNYDDAELKEVN